MDKFDNRLLPTCKREIHGFPCGGELRIKHRHPSCKTFVCRRCGAETGSCP